jgi:uncharacterized protein YheU (UPF0270 family)
MVWRYKQLTTKNTLGRTLSLFQGGISVGGMTSAVNQERSSVHSLVQAGDVVIVWATPEAKSTQSKDWWMGEVLRADDAPMGSDPRCFLQVADVETGMVCLVDCDQVQRVRIPIHAPLTTI